jgi:tungstate transport system substrate-binding protein
MEKYIDLTRRGLLVLITISILIPTLLVVWRVNQPRKVLLVATTTSLYESGVLDEVERAFEKREKRIDVRVIPTGTGVAMEYARRGDVDLILVHSPKREGEFLREGTGVCRKIIAYNFFIIIGPREDPAGIMDSDPSTALRRIVEAGRANRAVWISRGDESGTHDKERELWSKAGLEWLQIREEPWYIEVGGGMGETLIVAEEAQGYTLTDIGTYLKYRYEGHISLEALVERGLELLNVYSVIAVNPASNPDANFEDALKFIEFLISEEGQFIFANYGVEEYDKPLFNPAVEVLRDETSEIRAWIIEVAYINGYECPPEYRAGVEKLYG